MDFVLAIFCTYKRTKFIDVNYVIGTQHVMKPTQLSCHSNDVEYTREREEKSANESRKPTHFCRMTWEFVDRFNDEMNDIKYNVQFDMRSIDESKTVTFTTKSGIFMRKMKTKAKKKHIQLMNLDKCN